MPVDAPPAPPAAKESATIDAPAASEKAPSDYMADTMADFAEMDKAPSPAAKTDKPKSTPPPKKPASKTVEPPKKEEEKSEEAKKPEEPDKEKEKAEEQTETKPQGGKYMRALGEKYDNLKKQVEQEYKPELQKLRAKIQEYESHKTEDPGPLLEKVKTLEARNQELEKHIEFVDYTQSDDFKTKYSQPYIDAWQSAVRQFASLKIRQKDGENEMGEPTYKVRSATEDDLIRLGSMSEGDMDEVATREFGASAPRVIRHIEKLRELAAAKSRAQEEARKKATEFKTQKQAELHGRSETLAKEWMEVDKSLREKYPKAFIVEEGNDADKAAHTKGFALADLLFVGPESLTPEQVEALPEGFKESVKAKRPITDADRIRLHALARVKLANHDRQLARLKAAQLRIKELEDSLAAYEKSEPDAGHAGKGTPKAVTKDWLETAEDELKAMDR